MSNEIKLSAPAGQKQSRQRHTGEFGNQRTRFNSLLYLFVDVVLKQTSHNQHDRKNAQWNAKHRANNRKRENDADDEQHQAEDNGDEPPSQFKNFGGEIP